MRNLFSRLVVLGVGCLAALVLVELLLRLTGFSYPSLVRADPELGYTYVPGLKAKWTEEGNGSTVSINSSGFRDAEFSKEKSPDVYRVVLLGDSFMAGHGVEWKDLFHVRLRADLERCRGGTVEVLNFGISGYGTAQQYVCLKERALNYDPDLVLLAFTPWNDIADNSPALSTAYAPRPHFNIRNEAIELDMSFSAHLPHTSQNSRLKRKVINSSRTVQLIRRIRHLRSIQAAGDQVAGGNRMFAVYAPPKDEVWSEAWTLTEGIVALMSDELKARGVYFAMFSTTKGEQVHPEMNDIGGLTTGLRKIGLESLDFDYPDKRMAELARKESFPFLSLGTIFKTHYDSTNEVLHGWKQSRNLGLGHWNEAGHSLAASSVADWICSDRRLLSD